MVVQRKRIGSAALHEKETVEDGHIAALVAAQWTDRHHVDSVDFAAVVGAVDIEDNSAAVAVAVVFAADYNEKIALLEHDCRPDSIGRTDSAELPRPWRAERCVLSK